MRKVLVTGGTGYIGSHTVIQLLNAGFEVVILDNLSNSSKGVVARIEELSGTGLDFIEGDVRDHELLRGIFAKYAFDSAIHFAGLKAVGESQEKPLKYYDNNVTGSIVLFEEMMRAGVHKLIFSSSATVYGDPGYVCYSETTPLAPINVYGRTKLIVEDTLRDLKKAEPRWQIALLRYFNPVGAHISGRIGENPFGVPNNLMPFISQVAIGSRPKLMVYGNDYATPDGTGLRDYVHVEDLVAGHVAALNTLGDANSFLTLNLGTGKPYSVLEMIGAFERTSGVKIPYEIVERRAGDLPEYYANADLAKEVLGWQARLGIDRMCADTWRWQKTNPAGYVID
ncbi:UDP-glucose 4-epimerase GalE [Polynucleobacter sp.]|jgi:UDP-glucose 4-epimerase|uniref:UDP-glucose 4-epimerase GalE n=1 Tax=Polynucleobacter sp. TaxID=2029855 RepID=UPI0037C6077E